LSLKEAAEALGTTVTSVKLRTHRLRGYSQCARRRLESSE
jgi:DNA-directed RNA polymerase specialized sigma24 family protein